MEEPAREFDERNHVEIGQAWFRNPFGKVNPEKRVRASRDGLDVEGLKFVPIDAIERAFYAPRLGSRGRVIVIAKGRPRIAIEVLTRDEALRLLAALGFGVDRKQLTFTAESVVLRHGYRVLSMIFLATITGIFGEVTLPLFDFRASLLVNAAMFVTVAAFFAWLLRPSVVVGSDGIAVRQAAIGPRKFIAYDEIVRARHMLTTRRNHDEFDHALVIERKGEVDVRVQWKRGERNEDDAAGVAERIAEAMAARQSKEIPVTVESMLERGDRSVGEWIDALRRIHATEEVHYRVAPVDRESLFSAVEDATKKPQTRVAAAIALSERLDDAGRARLRVTADAVAEPKLRVALEQIADGAGADALAKIVDDLDAAKTSEG